MILIPSVFTGFAREGDFEWMLERHEYVDALFIFNDNEEQFRRFRNGNGGCKRGAGNAVIRPYRCMTPPRAAGIPTGTRRYGGYKFLNSVARINIDYALDIIRELVATGRYDKLVYSDDGQGGLGTGIFKVGQDVKDYIVKELHDLAQTTTERQVNESS